MTSNTDWENEFWQIVEEKGIGAHVDFILALRKMFRKHVALAEKRGQEKAVEFIRRYARTCEIGGIEEKLLKYGVNPTDYAVPDSLLEQAKSL